ISTIAWNLLIVSWVLYFLLKKSAKQARNYLILGSAGFIIIILSFVRVSLYSQFTEAVDSNNYFMSIVYSFVLSNPYPIITYLSYGFFGALVGLMIYNKRRDLLKKVIIPLGVFFLILGVYGAMQFEKSISTPDFFWYYKTNFELGIFLLAISGIYLAFEHKKKIANRMKILKLFSRISLTIYMTETFLSEILRYIVKPIFPNWDQTINGCLMFGAFNILVWTGIILLWKKSNFKYSLEYFWVKIFEKMGKKSTKTDF
ncbi:MAG: acyltransferase family protein, partial [Bacteroidota bacterium]|nr:acyltransferase family protein [Bacteroidota bacterium]